jgi:septum formation protein
MDSRIILASASPRRKELLTLAGLEFEIHLPDIDETPLKNELPRNMVKRLALGKAREVSLKHLENSRGSGFVIAADTTVVSPDGKNLGKPRDENEARRMVRALSGRTHRVHTGYALVRVTGGKVIHTVSRVVTTAVTMRSMSPQDIRNYVAKGECLDKAGAYAAQGYGMALIERIAGSYTNVVGIPVTHLLKDLRTIGWKR